MRPFVLDRNPDLLRLIRSHALGFAVPFLRGLRQVSSEFLPPQLCLESCQLCLDILLRLPFADDLLPVAAQEVVDRLNSNADRP
jgi:hypothetical protein